MKTYRLSLDDTFEDKFYIIAIYTDEEDYRMAFILNENLGLQLKKTKSILVKKDNAEFSIFEYDDISLYRNWFLLHNHSLVEREVVKYHDLFSQNTTQFHQKNFYLKELKKARFLLKIVTDESNSFLKGLTEKLQDIPQIYAVKLVHLADLKNTQLLLF